ncbi:MAG: hypothetical protein ACRDRZ_15420, partial [Pseudonocardiaceae bacterium]
MTFFSFSACAGLSSAASAFELAVGDDQELGEDPERDQLPAAHAHRAGSYRVWRGGQSVTALVRSSTPVVVAIS